MGFRIKKIHRQFLLVIGLFLFMSLVLNFVPTYYTLQNNLFLAMNAPIYQITLSNKTEHKSTYNRIWKTYRDNDKILDQLKFKPYVDTEHSKPKTILVEHGVSSWNVAAGNSVFVDQNCPVSHCQLEDFPEPGQLYDARIFKEIDIYQYVYPNMLEETPRHPEQVWIMFALESPEATPSYERLNHVINWTATYRTDSTLVTPYEKWLPFSNFTVLPPPSKNYAKDKSKLAAAFISNCQASNNRLEYIAELRQHIDVHVFGFCGDRTCDKMSRDECFEMLRKEYKFYLSFENANCRDYITEKLFLNALQYDILPVVMGAHPDDYKRAAPPGSYIHVEDFDTAKDLAEYLVKLDKNDKLYNDYFRWKTTGQFLNTKFWCRICSMLWDPQRPHTSVGDLAEWWSGNGTCIGKKRWKDI